MHSSEYMGLNETIYVIYSNILQLRLNKNITPMKTKMQQFVQIENILVKKLKDYQDYLVINLSPRATFTLYKELNVHVITSSQRKPYAIEKRQKKKKKVFLFLLIRV